MDSRQVKQSSIFVAFAAVQVADLAAFEDWIPECADSAGQVVDYVGFAVLVVDLPLLFASCSLKYIIKITTFLIYSLILFIQQCICFNLLPCKFKSLIWLICKIIFPSKFTLFTKSMRNIIFTNKVILGSITSQKFWSNSAHPRADTNSNLPWRRSTVSFLKTAT